MPKPSTLVCDKHPARPVVMPPKGSGGSHHHAIGASLFECDGKVSAVFEGGR